MAFKGQIKKFGDDGRIVVTFPSNELFGTNPRLLKPNEAQTFLKQQGIDPNSLGQYTSGVSPATSDINEINNFSKLFEKSETDVATLAQERIDQNKPTQETAKDGRRPDESLTNFLQRTKGGGQTGQQGNLPSGDERFVFGEEFLDKKANNAAVNQLYQSYFSRDASQAELNNWGSKGGADTTVRALEDFLKNERNNAVENGETNLPEVRGIDGRIISDVADKTKSVEEIVKNILENDPRFASLSDDKKFMTEKAIEGFTSVNPAEKAKAQKFLKEAQDIVDPENRLLLGFALDSIPDEFRIEKQSLEDKITTGQKRLEDINALMEDLPLEKQQEILALRRNFEQTIGNLQEQQTQAGGAFSSRRSQAEEAISLAQRDIQRSTNRSFDRRMSEIERTKEENEKNLKLTREAGQAQLKAMARSAEAQVGTEKFGGLNLKGLQGQPIAPIGGSTQKGEKLDLLKGDIETQRRQQILNLANTLGKTSDPEAVKQLFNK